MADTNEYVNKLKEFIDTNKDKKLHNSDVDILCYGTILDRRTEERATNVRAIRNVDKLVQYYLASRMLNCRNLVAEIERIISDTLGWAYLNKFIDMFSEVEIEFPAYKILNNPKVEIRGNRLVYIDKSNNEHPVVYDSVAEYKLLRKKPHLDIDAWKDFEYTMKAPIGSINISVPWLYEGDIKFDKFTGEYIALNVCFVADYPVNGKKLICRYSGLQHTSWVSASPLEGDKYSTTVRNSESEFSNSITTGYVYIGEGNRILASVRCDFDGYNNITFDQLLTLLEKSV